jgi:hypothetical protein
MFPPPSRTIRFSLREQKEEVLSKPICQECERVWQEYTSAAVEHITLDSKVRLAALSNNHEVIRALTRDVEIAEQERHWARQAIRTHEETHTLTNGAAACGRSLSDIN